MKKWLILFTLCFTALIFTACSEEESSNANNDVAGESGISDGNKQKVKLWYWNRGLDEEVLAKVNEEFPEVEFEAQKLPPGGDYKTKLTSLLTSKANDDSPDLVLMNVWLSEYLPYSDKFVNLYDYDGEEIAKNYPQWKVNQGVSADGKTLIAIPVDTAPTGFFYREDILKDAGIASSPEELHSKIDSWDKYVSFLKELKDKTNTYAESSIIDVFAKQINKLDKRYFNEKNEFIGDQAHIKEAWDRAVYLGSEGLVLGNIREQSQDWSSAVINNQISGYDGPVWAKDIVIDTVPDLSGKWKVSRSPVADGNDGGSFISVLNSTKNPELAVKIAAFINNEENQITSYRNMSLFPAHNDALSSSEIGNEEEYFGGQDTSQIFAESAKNVKEAFRGSKETIVFTAFKNELELIAVEKKDPEKAWEAALKQIEKDLNM